MTDKHKSRIDIFESTMEILRRGWYISHSGKRVILPSVEKVMSMATMYNKTMDLHIDGNSSIKTEIKVENKDCVVAAQQLIDKGYNPAILNLADNCIPGGLVEYGAGGESV